MRGDAVKRHLLTHAVRLALRHPQLPPSVDPEVAAAILRWIVLAALLVLVGGCDLLRPRVLVKPEVVEVVHEVRTPLPAALVQPRTVAEPDPACWWDTSRVYCNGQLAELRAEYRAALAQCNADKAALRQLDAALSGGSK